MVFFFEFACVSLLNTFRTKVWVLALNFPSRARELCTSGCFERFQTPEGILAAMALRVHAHSFHLITICHYRHRSMSPRLRFIPRVKSYSSASHAFISANQIKFIVPIVQVY